VVAHARWAFKVSQGSVETLFRWDEKSLHYSATNLFSKLCTKFHRNCPSFIEDITKNILVSFFRTQCICTESFKQKKINKKNTQETHGLCASIRVSRNEFDMMTYYAVLNESRRSNQGCHRLRFTGHLLTLLLRLVWLLLISSNSLYQYVNIGCVIQSKIG